MIGCVCGMVGLIVFVVINCGIWYYSVKMKFGVWIFGFVLNMLWMLEIKDDDGNVFVFVGFNWFDNILFGLMNVVYKNIVNDIVIDLKNLKYVVVVIGWCLGDIYNGFYEMNDFI